MKTHKNNAGLPNKHLEFMKLALSLAKRGLGNVWPNPAVGCVIVQDTSVVGRGWTQPSGRPHAETIALNHAGEKAKGASAYITLEPCNHTGDSPPCTEALIAAGIREVYVSISDPDPRVSGKGFERLKRANIDINVGLLCEAASEINKGFLLRIREGRPLLTFKTATTFDGKIATKDGESNWITANDARNCGHLLRAIHDATMIGSETAIIDDPQLNSRLPGINNQGRPRIILDRRLRLPINSQIVQTAEKFPVWLVTRDDHSSDKIQPYKDRNVNLIHVPQNHSQELDISLVMQELGRRGLTRILVEGGSRVAQSLFSADLVDQLAWFRSPHIIGDDGLSAIGELGIGSLSNIIKFKRTNNLAIGLDSLEILNRDR